MGVHITGENRKCADMGLVINELYGLDIYIKPRTKIEFAEYIIDNE